jgi:hypothetical protein
MLETIDLKELKSLEFVVSMDSGASRLAGGDPEGRTLLRAQELTIQRLQEVEQVFLRQTGGNVTEATGPLEQAKKREHALPPLESEGQRGQLLASAQLAAALGNYGETLKLCDQALTLSESNPFDQARLWLLRGRANYFLGRWRPQLPIGVRLSNYWVHPLSRSPIRPRGCMGSERRERQGIGQLHEGD